ncbi:MAG TPA: isochorismatase family protein [Geobacteraceae bacterium]|nr:isochorismatase family protein [Geobacteraceae bacterium]
MGLIKDKFFLDRDNAVLLVIDVQEKLCRAMDEKELAKLTGNVTILQETARELGLPMLATEQYVKGLGETLCILKEKLTEPAMEKMAFSCCGEAPFPERLRSLGRKQVIVTGMEAHVCVLQTVIELVDAGYHVHLVKDAVMSRRKENWQVGIEAAIAAGAVITSTEAAMFQLLRLAGSDEFKRLSKLVR